MAKVFSFTSVLRKNMMEKRQAGPVLRSRQIERRDRYR